VTHSLRIPGLKEKKKDSATKELIATGAAVKPEKFWVVFRACFRKVLLG